MKVQGQIRRLRAEGLSVRKIAKEVGVGTVMNYCRSGWIDSVRPSVAAPANR